MKLLVVSASLLFSVTAARAMDTFDSSFRYQPHPLIHIKLKDLIEASNPVSSNYNLDDRKWKKDFAEQQLAMHRNCQRELKNFFDKLLPTIKDPEEYRLIHDDMLSLVCKDPLEDTATQISNRFDRVIAYRNGYKRRLAEIARKEKIND